MKIINRQYHHTGTREWVYDCQNRRESIAIERPVVAVAAIMGIIIGTAARRRNSQIII